MCMIDNCDYFYSIWEKKVVTARVKHVCTECRRGIKVGERYELTDAMYQGDWDHFKTCTHCLAARTWLETVCGGYVARNVEQELLDHWHEDTSYRSMWLGRAIINMKHYWTKKDGTLMAVPSEFEGLPA